MSERAPGAPVAGGLPAPAHAHEAPYAPPAESVELDREIQYHQLIWLGLGLLGIAAISAVLVFFMLRGFVRWRATSTEPPPVMAPQPITPKEPKLLARPENELARVRAEEAEQLASYGWVNPAAGVVHIPIARAIDIIAAQGLPARTAATAADGATAQVPPAAEAPPSPASSVAPTATAVPTPGAPPAGPRQGGAT